VKRGCVSSRNLWQQCRTISCWNRSWKRRNVAKSHLMPRLPLPGIGRKLQSGQQGSIGLNTVVDALGSHELQADASSLRFRSLNTRSPLLDINQEHRHRLALPLDVYFAKKVLRYLRGNRVNRNNLRTRRNLGNWWIGGRKRLLRLGTIYGLASPTQVIPGSWLGVSSEKICHSDSRRAFSVSCSFRPFS